MEINGNALKAKLQKDGQGLIGQSMELKKIFQKTDGKTLRDAFSANDFKAACKVLGVDEAWMLAFFKAGTAKAAEFAKKHPEFAEAAKRKAAVK